jgi:hypothetical protein
VGGEAPVTPVSSPDSSSWTFPTNRAITLLRDSWQFITDGWIDGKGRTLLNFLVHCPLFLKSVDASAHVKDAALLCDLFDGFIQEVGLLSKS